MLDANQRYYLDPIQKLIKQKTQAYIFRLIFTKLTDAGLSLIITCLKREMIDGDYGVIMKMDLIINFKKQNVLCIAAIKHEIERNSKEYALKLHFLFYFSRGKSNFMTKTSFNEEPAAMTPFVTYEFTAFQVSK